MPARFAEVLDVGPSVSALPALIARGQRFWTALSANFSTYVNMTVSLPDSLPALPVIPNLSLDMNTTRLSEGLAPPPAGSSRMLMLVGVAILVLREVVIMLCVRRMLNKYGQHRATRCQRTNKDPRKDL